MNPETPIPMNLPQALHDAGCDPAICAELLSAKQTAQQIALLKRQRRTLMNNLHHAQREIDCLDFILQRLENHAGEE